MKKLSAFLLLLVLVLGAACPAPKNVIIMVGDGMGFEHLAAAEYYDNGGESEFFDWMTPLAMSTYSASGNGYDAELAWSDFDYVREGATDSGASATALSTGVMTNDGMIGVDPEGNRLKHLYQAAHEKGKSTGIITDVYLAHATPAAFAAHVERRDSYLDIARQMIGETSIDVIMGTGHPYYDNNGNMLAPEQINDIRFTMVGGEDMWDGLRQGTVGVDGDGNGEAFPWELIETREQFQDLITADIPSFGNPPNRRPRGRAGEMPGNRPRVLGLAQVEATLQESRGGDRRAAPYEVALTETVPTLTEMVKGALNVLGANRKGFFMMVEGGAIDWAGHGGRSGRVIEEQLHFRDAVYAVKEWVEANSSWHETLLIVTADHETGYLTGPAPDGVWAPVENRGKGNLPGMKWNSGQHTNSLVPLFIKGFGEYVISNKAETTGHDPVCGHYMHLTELSRVLHEFWE